MIWTLLACTTATVGDSEAPGARYESLPEALLLRRMSLDLRGVTPTLDELERLEQDPEALDELRREFLDDPRLEDRLVSFFAERWHTRLDEFQVGAPDYHLPGDLEFELERSVGEEPLRLMARIAYDDRPWTDIVTADHSMANPLLGQIWELDYPAGSQGWREVHYDDGRPAVGVLATNGLWWRYTTNSSNMNRSRAAAIARLLLCQDLLSRPVSLDGAIQLDEEDGTAEAISTVPGCVACHATIEPLAASLFGFWTVIGYNPDELSSYHPEREQLGPVYLGVQPGYYGQPIEGLVELGAAIANDSRFYRCAAQSAAEALWRRPVGTRDFRTIDELRRGFLVDGLLYRELLVRVTDTEEYRAGALGPAATEEDLQRERTWRMQSPDQLSTSVEELTGFLWTWQGFEQLANDDPGYRVLAGGVDGWAVTRPQQDPGLTWAIFVERLAQAAAAHTVDRELVDGGARRLLLQVELTDRPGDPAWDEDLAQVYLRLFAELPSDEELSEVQEIWTQLESSEGPAEAWKLLLSALLRDPRFVGY